MRTSLREREAIARVIASVSRVLRVDLNASGGMMPPTAYVMTTDRKLVCRVFLNHKAQLYSGWFIIQLLNGLHSAGSLIYRSS